MLHAAYGLLLVGGLLHYGVEVISQHARGKRVPGAETTLYDGLHAAYALGQVLLGAAGLLLTRQAPGLLDRRPLFLIPLAGAAGWGAICLRYIESREPRGAVLTFGVLLLAAWFTRPRGIERSAS